VEDDTLPGGAAGTAPSSTRGPFERCDRERDYEIVWAEFEKRR